jgi:hypothetical protein
MVYDTCWRSGFSTKVASSSEKIRKCEKFRKKCEIKNVR